MESNEQERKNLMKMPGDFKQMSSGSWLSKHISSPLAKGKAHSMAPQMNNGALYQLGSETKSEKEEKKEKPKPKKKQTFFDKQVLPQIKLDRLSKKQLKRMRS